MNRLVIVGHPSSNYQIVEELLHQRGMNSLCPSKRENLSPQDITQTLRKAYQSPDIYTVTDSADFEPLHVSTVWNGIALDLMLSNLNQKLCGWSDPNAIHTLEYWKSVDENITFILIYDHPKSILTNYFSDQNISSNYTSEHLIKNWLAYNTALLHFFLNNRGRCLLVSSEQVKRNAEDCIQQLQHKLKLKFGLSFSNTINHSLEQSVNDFKTAEAPITLEKEHQEIMSLSGIDIGTGDIIFKQSETEEYLIFNVLNDYPDCKELYFELQSNANTPLRVLEKENYKPSFIWETFIKQRQITLDIVNGLYQSSKKIILDNELHTSKQLNAYQAILKELSESKEELIQYDLIIKNKTIQVQELECAIENLESLLKKEQNKNELQQQRLEKLSCEKELLLNQLHLVQQKLEQYFIDNQRLEKKQLPELYGAAERIKQDIGYRLGAVMVSRSKTFLGLISIPFALISEWRTWKKKYDSEYQVSLPSIFLYADKHEAERVKKHLSYQLGKLIINKNNFPLGLISLPFSIYRTIRQFKRTKNNSQVGVKYCGK
ncbi:TPA: hypothetical protein ACIX31_003273 [Escherichia coli]